MRKRFLIVLAFLTVLTVGAGFLLTSWVDEQDRAEQGHYRRSETELIVSNTWGFDVQLYKAGRDMQDTVRMHEFNGGRVWLTAGNYFLKVSYPNGTMFHPVPIKGYRSGPDDEESFMVTVRPYPTQRPPKLLPEHSDFVYIPSGWFLLGDRLNPREPHHVWTTGYYVSPFEVTNREFRFFLDASDGYADDQNWSEDGRAWKRLTRGHTTAALSPAAQNYRRFGQPDQPITWITWFEANAYCAWLTRKVGNGRWQFSLPTEAEWEKAARGPDNFDYALGNILSDNEVILYNWKKNPDAPTTVADLRQSLEVYKPNRFGLYHMTGNVVEWTQSVNRPYNREHPFAEDDRNHSESRGLRVARGGSWYSASIAYLYIPYRDAFQPEHSTQDIGFRIVAKALPFLNESTSK